MTGKHRRTRRSPARNLAATAAVLTAGALPLAAAGSAFAADAPAAGAAQLLQFTGEPGLEQVAQPLQSTLPVADAVPLAKAVADDVKASVDTRQVPVGGLDATTPQLRAEDAAVNRETALESAALATKATDLARPVGSALPVSGLVGQFAPALAGTQGAPQLLPDQTVGTLNGDFAAKATGLADGFAGRMSPVAQELRGAGVPTVGDVTSTVGGAQVPLFGTVGGLTSAMPVSQALGAQSPVIGAVGAAGAL
jgi:hypothetical protein